MQLRRSVLETLIHGEPDLGAEATPPCHKSLIADNFSISANHFRGPLMTLESKDQSVTHTELPTAAAFGPNHTFVWSIALGGVFAAQWPVR